MATKAQIEAAAKALRDFEWHKGFITDDFDQAVYTPMAKAALEAAEAAAWEPLQTRPVAFRVPRTVTSTRAAVGIEWRYFTDEAQARALAEDLGTDYQGLYVRDGATAPASPSE